MLSLPSKFAIRRRLDDVDIEADDEMCMAKNRYQIQKAKEIRDSVDYNEGETEKSNKCQRLELELLGEMSGR